jgi:hypothetical protein
MSIKQQKDEYTQKLHAQEKIIGFIERIIMDYFDTAEAFLQQKPLHVNTGSDGHFVRSINEAIRFCATLEPLEKVSRYIIFPDQSSLLINKALIDTLIRIGNLSPKHASSWKLMLTTLCTLKLQTLFHPQTQDMKATVTKNILGHCPEYIDAKNNQLRLINESFCLDEEDHRQYLEVQRQLLQDNAPQEKKFGRRWLWLLLGGSLLTGALFGGGYISADLQRKAVAKALAGITADDLSQEEKQKLWEQIHGSVLRDAQAQEQANIVQLINQTGIELLSHNLSAFSNEDFQKLNTVIDSALIRFATMHGEIEPSLTTVEKYGKLLDAECLKIFGTQTQLQSQALLSDPRHSFRYLPIKEALEFIELHRDGNLLSSAEKIKIALAVNLFSFKKNYNPRIIHAMIWAESHYGIYEVSPKKAVGLLQLMPETNSKGKIIYYGGRPSWRYMGITNPRDILQNIGAGINHLYASNLSWVTGADNELWLALVAYYAGTGNLIDYVSQPAYQIKISTTQNIKAFIRNTLHQEEKYTVTKRGAITTVTMYGIMKLYELQAGLAFLEKPADRDSFASLYEVSQKKAYSVPEDSFAYAKKIIDKYSEQP